MYRVRYKLEFNSTPYLADPLLGDDFGVLAKREDDSRLLREEFTGEVSFIETEYSLIMAEDLTTQFFLIKEIDTGSGWVERLRGYFYRTYCEINEDIRCVKVKKIVTVDKYEELLNGADRVFNIPDLGVPTVTVNYQIQPIIQIYVAGANFLTNITSGNHWEQPVTATTNQSQLENDFKFLTSLHVHYIPGRGVLDPDIGGQYFYDQANDDYSNGNYDVRYDSGAGRWKVHDILNSDVVVYEGTPGQADVNLTELVPVGGSGTNAKFLSFQTYTRVILNKDTFLGDPTEDIPEDDIIPPTRNYTKVIGLDYNGLFASDSNSSTNQGFGRFADDAIYFANEFFALPTNNLITERYFPFHQSEWEEASLWAYFDPSYHTETTTETVTDAYKFADVLGAVVAQLNPNITHQDDIPWSQFLYAPTNDIRGKQKWPILVPKSNIVIGDYSQPAKRAEVTLNDLIDFMRGRWHADWYVDSGSRFVIEHEQFYHQGKAYTTTNIGLDLTTLIEPHTGLPWATDENTYEYDLENLTAVFEFQWQEEGSDTFDGVPIEITTGYVNPQSTVKHQTSRFYADLDFALIGDVIRTGWMFLECEENDGEYDVPIVEVDFRGKTYKVNNGYASIVWMVNQYWQHVLPAPDALLNLEAITAVSTMRGRTKEIGFAGVDFDGLDLMQLINTDLGVAEVVEARIFDHLGQIEVNQAKLDTE